MATQYTAGLSSGQVLTAATMNSIGAAWESYTPTWTAATTNPVLNNGSISGQWARIQKIAFVNIFLVMGSTTTYGASAWRFSLPSGVTMNGNNTHGGTFLGFDASAGYISYVGVVNRVTSTTVELNPQGGYAATNTVPFAWAVNDQLRIMMIYQTD